MEATLLHHYLEKAADLHPEKEALTTGAARVTYAEFLDTSKNLARALLELGVEKGDRVAVLMPTSIEYIYTYMAASMVGAILAGINPNYKGPEIAYILNNSLPRVLIMKDKHRDVDLQKVIREHIFPGVIPYIVIQNTQQKKKFLIRRAIDFETLMDIESQFDEEALSERKETVAPGDGVLVIYTAGIMGKPKGVVLTHQNILTTTRVQAQYWEIVPEDRILLHLPMSHIGGAVELFITGLTAGATQDVMSHFNPLEAMKRIENEKITVLGQVPTMYVMMFHAPGFEHYDLSSLRMLAVAGAPSTREIIEKMSQIVDGPVRTGYGLSETAGFVTHSLTEDPPTKLYETVGKPVPDFQFKIVDEERKELPEGETGEVAIKGDCVFKEYFEQPTETEKSIDPEGWFYTGDMGFFDQDGYLVLRGRKKDMMITGGFTVFPQEIEDKLNRHPQIQMAAVCGVPAPVLGEIGRAFVVPQPGKIFKQSEIIDYLGQYLADFKIPQQFSFRDSLPLTPTGEVEKRILQEEIANQG